MSVIPLRDEVATIGRGTTNPEVKALFDPMGEEVKYRKELWPLFVMAALGLLLLDLLLRRLRLGGATELSWERVTRPFVEREPEAKG